MRRLILLAAGSIALDGALTAPALSQEPVRPQQAALRGLDDAKLGAKLRVTAFTSPPQRIIGRHAGLVGTTLTVSVSEADRRTVDILQPLRIDEAYRDRWRGALLGVLPGIIGVYAWDFFGPHPRYADQSRRYRENAIALVVTTAVGGAIGAAIGWERWRLVHSTQR